MRLDHIAYRVKDRNKTAEFFIEAFGYKVQTEFEPTFADGTSQGVKCIALEPPEKTEENGHAPPFRFWTTPEIRVHDPKEGWCDYFFDKELCYHMAPEVFISDGPPESIVGKWVAERDGIGGVHHFAYQVEDVQAVMDEWKEKGYAEFLSDKPLTCPGLTQVFTKPSELCGVIFEFITRDKHGFCAENVGALMESTEQCR